MSYFGGWTCPACGRSWMGSIGWTWPDNLDEWLEKICGCTEKQITDTEAEAAMTISVLANDERGEDG